MRFLRTLGPAPLIFLAFWLLLMVAGRSRLLRDPGTFWHTSVGERILHEGFFSGDPFTFSHAQERWVPHQWLGEITMALVHRCAGFDGFVLLAVSILAGLFTVLAMRLMRTGLHPILVATIVGIGLAVASGHFHVRPLLMTIVGLAILQIMLANVESNKIAIEKLYWLVPLFVLWSNIHGGMLGGWATLILVACGWVVARIVSMPTPVQTSNTMKHLFLVVLGCGLAAFVNPYGWEIPRAWLIIMLGPKIPQVIEEHRPLEFADPMNWCTFLFAGIYLFVLSGARFRDLRVTWLVPIFWFLQALMRVRHAPLFAVVTLIAIAEIWPWTRWAHYLAAKRADLYDPKLGGDYTRTNKAFLVPALLVAMVFLSQMCGTVAPIVGLGWAKLDRERWPIDLIEVMRENEPKEGKNHHLFNECEYGGFAIFYTPGYKVFVDDRAELYGDDWLEAYIKAEADIKTAVQNWEPKYGRFDFALTRNDSSYDKYFSQSPEWTRLKRGESGSFYRRTPETTPSR